MALIQSSQHTIHDGNKLKTVERGNLNSAWGLNVLITACFIQKAHITAMKKLCHQFTRLESVKTREGGFNSHQDEHSGIDCNDTTADFANDSAFGSGSLYHQMHQHPQTLLLRPRVALLWS
jgi:SIT4-associating protein SAP185/190